MSSSSNWESLVYLDDERPGTKSTRVRARRLRHRECAHRSAAAHPPEAPPRGRIGDELMCRGPHPRIAVDRGHPDEDDLAASGSRANRWEPQSSRKVLARPPTGTQSRRGHEGPTSPPTICPDTPHPPRRRSPWRRPPGAAMINKPSWRGRAPPRAARELLEERREGYSIVTVTLAPAARVLPAFGLWSSSPHGAAPTYAPGSRRCGCCCRCRSSSGRNRCRAARRGTRGHRRSRRSSSARPTHGSRRPSR
jgi:hypothetical protein